MALGGGVIFTQSIVPCVRPEKKIRRDLNSGVSLSTGWLGTIRFSSRSAASALKRGGVMHAACRQQ